MDTARNFLIYLLDNKYNTKALSRHAYTHCLMYLLKTNELAQMFVQKQGFAVLQNILQNECLQNG